eukprot:1251906-Prymnesium_polylepis.1
MVWDYGLGDAEMAAVSDGLLHRVLGLGPSSSSASPPPATDGKAAGRRRALAALGSPSDEPADVAASAWSSPPLVGVAFAPMFIVGAFALSALSSSAGYRGLQLRLTNAAALRLDPGVLPQHTGDIAVEAYFATGRDSACQTAQEVMVDDVVR